MELAKHLAFKYSFSDLLSGLQQHVKQGYVNKQHHNELTLFNYNRSCQFEKAWDDFSLVARGLILHEPAQKIVALPFPKFFNFGELSYEIPNLPFTIKEKLDGSLGIIFYWQKDWHVATRGSFFSEQARWANAWLHSKIDLSLLNPSVTYLSEIIYNSNRIVVNYDFEGLVLLSAYSLKTGAEVSSDDLQNLANKTAFRYPNCYEHSFSELLELAKTLPTSLEGFVVQFAEGSRLKIKGDEYCRVHRLISDLTPLGIWQAMMANDDLEALRKEIPEEYQQDFDVMVELLEQSYQKIIQEVTEAYQETKNLTAKELGLKIQNDPDYFTEAAHKFIFTARKTSFFQAVKTKSPLRQKVFKLFRPTSNILKGYQETSAINRFFNEN